MNQKKEYVAPEMDVVEYMVEASLLVDSPKTDDAADTPNVLTGGSFD